MAHPSTAAANSGHMLTLDLAIRAFDLWETRFRESPTDFLTVDELARMEVATAAERSGIYFMALLREVA